MEMKLSYRETNSSSAHALMFGLNIVNGKVYNEVTKKSIKPVDLEELLEKMIDNEYGWGYEEITDRDIIVHYILCQAADNLDPSEFADVIYSLKIHKFITNVTFRGKYPYEYQGLLYGKIDHQSIWGIQGRKTEFFTWMLIHALAGNIDTLYVGNDNSMTDYPPTEKIDVLGLLLRYYPITVYRPSETSLVLVNDLYKLYIKDKTLEIVECESELRENKYPALIDTLITLKCKRKCPYCYIGASPRGKKAKIESILSFVEKIPEYSIAEVALGGGDVLSDPELLTAAVSAFSSKGSLVSLTVRPEDLRRRKVIQLIESLSRIAGPIALGVTLETVEDYTQIKKRPRCAAIVYHYVNGVSDPKLLTEIEYAPILILGYKQTEANSEYKPNKMLKASDIPFGEHPFSWHSGYFGRPILFDDLAIEQLGLERGKQIPERDWDVFYLGKGGERSWFVDFVNKFHGPNSYQQALYRVWEKPDDIIGVWRNALKI